MDENLNKILMLQNKIENLSIKKKLLDLEIQKIKTSDEYKFLDSEIKQLEQEQINIGNLFFNKFNKKSFKILYNDKEILFLKSTKHNITQKALKDLLDDTTYDEILKSPRIKNISLKIRIKNQK